MQPWVDVELVRVDVDPPVVAGDIEGIPLLWITFEGTQVVLSANGSEAARTGNLAPGVCLRPARFLTLELRRVRLLGVMWSGHGHRSFPPGRTTTTKRSGVHENGGTPRSQLPGLSLAGTAARACQCQTDEAAERTEQRQVGVPIGGAGLWTREQQGRDRPGALGTVAADEQVVAA